MCTPFTASNKLSLVTTDAVSGCDSSFAWTTTKPLQFVSCQWDFKYKWARRQKITFSGGKLLTINYHTASPWRLVFGKIARFFIIIIIIFFSLSAYLLFSRFSPVDEQALFMPMTKIIIIWRHSPSSLPLLTLAKWSNTLFISTDNKVVLVYIQ